MRGASAASVGGEEERERGSRQSGLWGVLRKTMIYQIFSSSHQNKI